MTSAMSIADGIGLRRRLYDALSTTDFIGSVDRVCDLIAATLRGGGTVYLCGNGGSAADCDHIAAELVGRFRLDRAPLPAMALTTSLAALTAIANDYSYDEVFARQVAAFVTPRDALLGLSTSGNSPNVVRAMEAARRAGAATVALTGSLGDKLADIADVSVRVPSTDPAQIQEATLMVGHLICGAVEARFNPGCSWQDPAPAPAHG
jgi:D-sedoheptulose 7-phosphate isomerase